MHAMLRTPQQTKNLVPHGLSGGKDGGYVLVEYQLAVDTIQQLRWSLEAISEGMLA